MPAPRRWALLTRGLGVALLLLFLLEVAASLLPLESFDRKFIDPSHPFFVPGKREFAGRYVSNPYARPFMNFQTFACRKAPGVTRVFFLGGSAALGWPSSEECSFTGSLRRILEKNFPGRFEIINAAVMSFGSHRVFEVLRDVVELEPDLVVIWCGNNEFVEHNAISTAPLGGRLQQVNRLLLRSHLYRGLRWALFKLAPFLLSRPGGSDLTDMRQAPRVKRGSIGRLPEIDREILENYRRNLAEMARILQDRGVAGIFCTVPVNLAGWAPFSVAPRFGDRERAGAWRASMEQGVKLLDRGDNRGAAGLFSRALEITPNYALAAYFEAQALQRLGEYARAYELFLRARDLDARPLRVIGPFNEAVRAVASEQKGLALVDLEKDFRAASGPNLVGLDFFIDYCHPNSAGHKVAAHSLLLAVASRVPGFRSIAALETDLLADTCPPPAAPRLAAEAYARGLTHQNNGNNSLAEQAYAEALGYKPDFSAALSNLGLLLLERGARAEGENLTLHALEVDSGNTGALFQMGLIRLDQGRIEEAAVFLRRILAGNARNPLVHETLGDIALRKGSPAEAVVAFRTAVEQGGEHFLLRRKLGDAYHALAREDEAIREWRLALELNPDDEELRRRLEDGETPTGRGAPR